MLLLQVRSEWKAVWLFVPLLDTESRLRDVERPGFHVRDSHAILFISQMKHCTGRSHTPQWDVFMLCCSLWQSGSFWVRGTTFLIFWTCVSDTIVTCRHFLSLERTSLDIQVHSLWIHWIDCREVVHMAVLQRVNPFYSSPLCHTHRLYLKCGQCLCDITHCWMKFHYEASSWAFSPVILKCETCEALRVSVYKVIIKRHRP